MLGSSSSSTPRLLLLLLLPAVVAGCGSSYVRDTNRHVSDRIHEHEADLEHASDHLSQSELTRLYNTRVTYVECWKRPFAANIPHAGIVVTTENGGQWLIHKGKKYASDSSWQTVVVDPKHMSGQWNVVPSSGSMAYPGVTVGDLVRHGGHSYNVFSSNCLHAANDMKRYATSNDCGGLF
ncbi:uncharacterized protein LOC116957551 [Petromyzon marinus]|uniref:uncharacterized protein LOC116957551 n=1 Tax=Petromyzon marinus TaxID=7757 RepID=UPI003F71E9C6